jgi:hypothetical protein
MPRQGRTTKEMIICHCVDLHSIGTMMGLLAAKPWNH